MPLEEDKDLESRPINRPSHPGMLRVKDNNGGASSNGGGVVGGMNGGGGMIGGGNGGVNGNSVGGGVGGGGAYLSEPAEDNDPDVIPHKAGEKCFYITIEKLCLSKSLYSLRKSVCIQLFMDLFEIKLLILLRYFQSGSALKVYFP